MQENLLQKKKKKKFLFCVFAVEAEFLGVLSSSQRSQESSTRCVILSEASADALRKLQVCYKPGVRGMLQSQPEGQQSDLKMSFC